MYKIVYIQGRIYLADKLSNYMVKTSSCCNIINIWLKLNLDCLISGNLKIWQNIQLWNYFFFSAWLPRQTSSTHETFWWQLPLKCSVYLYDEGFHERFHGRRRDGSGGRDGDGTETQVTRKLFAPLLPRYPRIATGSHSDVLPYPFMVPLCSTDDITNNPMKKLLKFLQSIIDLTTSLLFHIEFERCSCFNRLV